MGEEVSTPKTSGVSDLHYPAPPDGVTFVYVTVEATELSAAG